MKKLDAKCPRKYEDHRKDKDEAENRKNNENLENIQVSFILKFQNNKSNRRIN